MNGNSRNLAMALCCAVLIAACNRQKAITLWTKEEDVNSLRQVLISKTDTILHGISATLTAMGDTLSKQLYKQGHLIQDWQYNLTAGTITHRDYHSRKTVIIQKSENSIHSKKVLQGDSILSWTFFDESGQAFSRHQWQKMHSSNYYHEYLKYLNLKADIPLRFKLRALLIPINGRPGLIDITSSDKVHFHIFDYSDQKFEYIQDLQRSKQKWVKYNTQLHSRMLTPSSQLIQAVEDFLKHTHEPFSYRVDCNDSCDMYFILTEDGVKLKFFITEPGQAPQIVMQMQNQTGYIDEYQKINDKLERWKTEKKVDYFLEEILKLPYKVE